MELAPVALFVYNRPEHTRRTVEALRANELAPNSDLFVFSDGPRNESAAGAVREVREFIRNIDGFRSVTLIEREQNLGLSKSVIAGVTQLCNEFERAIVVEDDVMTAPDFLNFMNRALARYEAETEILSISGFNFALNVPENYPYDAVCSYRSSSWGWGTWKDRWDTVDWDISDYPAFQADKNRRQLFNRGGQDLSRMLDWQMAGKIDSWAIRWAYAHFTKDAVALLSTKSKVTNIGLDGSGVHSKPGAARQSEIVIERNSDYRFPVSLQPDPSIIANVQRACRPPLPRRFGHYVRDKLVQMFAVHENHTRL